LRFAEHDFSVVVGTYCWICYGAKLVRGVRIGDGVIVLACAVITKDVPPYSIVGGVPAKVLKYRYKEEDIQILRNIKWWNHDISWFEAN
jgi:chloramphenicol O-acetyltransferase type B